MWQACKYYGVNPLHGVISFDDIGSAWMTIYQCVTLEGWTDVLYMTSRVEGIASGIYFVSLVVFGSFYVLNLFLAVLWETYCDANAAERWNAALGRRTVHAVRRIAAGEEITICCARGPRSLERTRAHPPRELGRHPRCFPVTTCGPN